MGKNDEATLKEVQRILDNFSKTLESVEIKEKSIKSKDCGYRPEGNVMKEDREFRERMFKNAPQTEGDFIIAEKKKW